MPKSCICLADCVHFNDFSVWISISSPKDMCPLEFRIRYIFHKLPCNRFSLYLRSACYRYQWHSSHTKMYFLILSPNQTYNKQQHDKFLHYTIFLIQATCTHTSQNYFNIPSSQMHNFLELPKDTGIICTTNSRVKSLLSFKSYSSFWCSES